MTFGVFDLDVIPGVDVVVDIGGPDLAIVFPESDLFIDASQVTVHGLVTDDVEVTGVTVNGVVATLASTNDPDDAAQLTFEATIPLPVKGPNEIVTVATDTSGKTATDTRTVLDDAGPPVLEWVPADGTTTIDLSVLVEGTVADDAGIDSIVVNGVPVVFSPTVNPDNEIHFSASVGLHLGDNFVDVVATDISTRTIAQTHKITVVENRPPTANAGGAYAVDEGGIVVLAGLGSDPDGDPLTFMWDLDGDGVFDDGVGSAPTF